MIARTGNLAASAGVTVLALVGQALATPPNAGAAGSPVLLRYPYLTDTTASSAALNLETSVATPRPVVTWGPAGTCTGKSANASIGKAISTTPAGWQFTAKMGSLTANTSYCYRVTQSGVDLLGADASPTFSTAIKTGVATPYSFAVLGDWGAGSTDEAAVLQQVAASPTSFVVSTGDNAYNSGTQADYGTLQGGNVFGPSYWKLVGATRPAYQSHGNHGFTGNLPYLQNWPQKSVVTSSSGRYQQDSYCGVSPAPACPAGNQYASSWYAFNWGNARYYILEGAWTDKGSNPYQDDLTAHLSGPVSGCTPCGLEQTWLQNDLAAHASTRVKFAFWHYPIYSDDPNQTSDTYLQGSSQLEGLLAANGVDIVFNGHAHVYERNTPQISGSHMLSYVTGGGGAPLGRISACSAFDAYALGSGTACGTSVVSDQHVYHFLVVHVDGSTVTVSPTDELGQTFDVQTYNFSAAGR